MNAKDVSVIYKYELDHRNHGQRFAHDVPEGASFVSVGLDLCGRVCVWLKCNPEAKKTVRLFLVVFTGAPFCGSNPVVLGTVAVPMDAVIVHVFEEFV